MRTLSGRQRGIGLVGMILIASGLIFVVIVGMKMVPPYVHNAQVKQIFREIVGDPAMQNASIGEIKMSFRKRADINYITDISPDDIEISKDGGSLSMSASYEVRIPVAGNITLLLELNPSI